MGQVWLLAAKQPYAALVCRSMVSTLVITTATHLPTLKLWKAELARGVGLPT